MVLKVLRVGFCVVCGWAFKGLGLGALGFRHFEGGGLDIRNAPPTQLHQVSPGSAAT